MSILEIIKKRRSVRVYKDKEIPPKLVDELIEALIWAPSAGNLQSRKFYFIYNEKVKDDLVKASSDKEFISQAPLVVVACTDDKIEIKYGERGKKKYAMVNVACSLMNLSLLAEELGLATVWVGAFNEDAVRKILDIPNNLHPVLIMPVGYADEVPEVPDRVSKDEAVIEVR